QACEGMRAVLDAEVGDALALVPFAIEAEVRDEGVVCVQDEGRPGRPVGDHASPLVRELLELAVTVELIPEQVPEYDRPGSEGGRHLLEPGLVDLEEPEQRALEPATAGARYERGRDTARHVRSGAVVHDRNARSF